MSSSAPQTTSSVPQTTTSAPQTTSSDPQTTSSPPTLTEEERRIIDKALSKCDPETLSFKAFVTSLKEGPLPGILAKKAQVREEVGRLLALMEGPEEEAEAEDDSDSDSSEEEEDVKPKKRGATGGGFQKPVRLSPALASVLGEDIMPRTQVVKAMWAYFREHDLQNPKDKRQIILDEALRGVFGVKKFTGFNMNKHLTKHLYPLEDEVVYEEEDYDSDGKDDDVAAPQSSAPKSKPRSSKKSKPVKPAKKSSKEAKPKVRRSQPIFALTPAMSKVTGRKTLSRGGCTKLIWKYIKANGCQDPGDGRVIVCDETLKGIFGGEKSVNMMKIATHIKGHLGEKVGMTDTKKPEDIVQ